MTAGSLLGAERAGRSFGLLRLFFWLHWRSLRSRFAKSRKESPLLSWVLAAFAVGYLISGFVLFRSGLLYLYKFPLVGGMIAERILYLIFGLFFVMLTVSNLIVGYATLFKNRETHWLLCLPVRHRDVYRLKFIEALVVSSWALIYLSTPMLAAYGVVHEVEWFFYVFVALGYMPFVVLPAVLGSWMILWLVRMLSRPWMKWLLALIGALVLAGVIFGIKPVTEAEAAGVSEALLFPKLMRGTEVVTHGFLPSAWLAEAVKSWSAEGLWKQGMFYFLLLSSYAMLGLLLVFDLAGRVFYGSWSAAQSSRAERFQKLALAKKQRSRQRNMLGWIQDRVRKFSPGMVAMIFKDIRIFWRDPAQWSQFAIFFGLLCIYVANLRNVAFEFKQPYWEVMISYMNLAASALTLSTLTTRFVFPMFSLEGRRVWILGLSPMGLRRVVWQKFWMSFGVSALTTVALMIASATILKLSWQRMAYFCMTVTVMSAALSALSVGLGALFPSFKEENPSKIVSSFGGTLCLVISFAYNAAVVALLALPEFYTVTKRAFPFPGWFSPAIALLLSMGIIAIPLFLATQRVKNLEM